MVRRRKSADDERTNQRIGDTLLRLRKERGWTLQYVASSLGLSVPHVSALETGQYTFSAALVEKLARLFRRPLSTFLQADAHPDTLSAEWRHVYDLLPERDRLVLLDVARKLSNWSAARERVYEEPQPNRGGYLISIEGIDGEHLDRLGRGLLAKGGDHLMTYCPYDHGVNLWRYMITHFAKLDREDVAHRALERTMLYACERLLRYEDLVQPALEVAKVVIAPFFTMAPSVYQEVEGVGDRRLVDIAEALLPKPDTIVVLRSEPAAAARKAVPHEPGPGQFYSPYSRDQLARARRLYEKAIEEFSARGYQVHVFEAGSSLPDTVIEAVYERVIVQRFSTMSQQAPCLTSAR